MKWFKRIVLILFLLLVIAAFSVHCYMKSTTPPSIENAPFAIQGYYQEADGRQIPTRYYYAVEVNIVDGNAIINHYWEYDGKKYHEVTGEKIINPPFDVIRRIE